MKRLYRDVGVADAPKGFVVVLDERPVRTPGRRQLVLPTRPLAEGIADEWRAQGTEIVPHAMPLMQLAATVLDDISVNRKAVETTILRFAETDTVCYRAEQPDALNKYQHIRWDPLLDWLTQYYGASLVKNSGILPIPQPKEAMLILAKMMEAMDDWRLGAFQSAAASSGSFVIALALIDARIDADEAFHVAELESEFELDRWGDDPAAAARRAVVASDLAAARRFHDLLGH